MNDAAANLKIFEAIDRTGGMHFVTTTLQSATCGLTQVVLAAAYLAIEFVKLLVSIWLEYARSAV